MDRLYVVIPAYNERENIQDIIEQWYQVVVRTGPESRLVIVNDGSKDDTWEIMKACQEGRPQFLPLTKENGGHGAAVLYGYQYALEAGADYIFQTDSDGQTLPEEFWPFWEQRAQYDMLIGNRNHRQDGFSRVVVTKVLKLVVLLCFGVRAADVNTPFRLMSARTMKEIVPLIPKDFFLSNVLLVVFYMKKKLSVKYLPITFRPRQGGVNSINLRKIFKVGKKALGDFWKINRSLKK
jgi:dolichol-phosphate mannosyltransferase